jgi:hypothetical protein
VVAFICNADAWATSTHRLLAPGVGRLLTLMFPCERFDGGPPYAMSVELYQVHLPTGQNLNPSLG